MNYRLSIDPISKILHLTVDGEDHELNLFHFNSGATRLAYALSTVRAVQEAEGEPPEKLLPGTLRDLGSLFKANCFSAWSGEAAQAIWNGQNRYRQATSMPPASFHPQVFGRYAYIYRHPTEPRFGAIKAEKVWTRFIEARFEEYFGLETPEFQVIDNMSHLLDFFLSCGPEQSIRQMVWFRPPVPFMDTRTIQIELGCLIKTGKVLEHLLDCHDFPADKLSILAGYVQDALRANVADISSVQVTDDVGSVYRMAGSFTSCMRSLGWDDHATGNDSYQIYKDLGARIAYITIPEGEGKRLTARAILWDDVEVVWRNSGEVDHIKIMDTIYRNGSAEQAAMTKWARQNGYAYKTTECSYSCSRFTYGPDRTSEDFDLDYTRSARVYRPDGKPWTRGMYARVPWVDIFPYAKLGDHWMDFHSNGGTCLHSQSGKGGFLTTIVECKYCNTQLNNTEDEENWHSAMVNGNEVWTCPRCYDLNWTTCCECDDEGPTEEFVEYDGEYYCSNCANENLYRCEDCGEIVGDRENPNEAYFYQGECFCDSCFNDRFSYCDECDEYYPSDMVSWWDDIGKAVCDDCFREYYAECDECGHIYNKDQIEDVYITTKHEGKAYYSCRRMCESCRGALNVASCDSCGELWDALDPRRDEVGEEDWLCCDCFQDRYRKCHSCGEWHKKHEVETRLVAGVGHVGICEQCRMEESGNTYHCDVCNGIYDDRIDRRVLVGFQQFCPYCWKAEIRASMQWEAKFALILRRR